MYWLSSKVNVIKIAKCLLYPLLVNITNKTFSVRMHAESSLLDNNKYKKPCFNLVRSTDQNKKDNKKIIINKWINK